MTADSAEENSLSSKRSWNLKAELLSICLNAGGAETALGSIKAAQWRRPVRRTFHHRVDSMARGFVLAASH
jgi:hypothetical protein